MTWTVFAGLVAATTFASGAANASTILAPENGLAFGYINNGSDEPTIIAQTVGDVVSGQTYTLSVYVGNRNDSFSSCFAGTNSCSAVELVIGSTAYTATGPKPAPGQWSDWTVTYVAKSADVGHSITIELINKYGPQSNFDNVTLTGSGVTILNPSFETSFSGPNSQLPTVLLTPSNLWTYLPDSCGPNCGYNDWNIPDWPVIEGNGETGLQALGETPLPPTWTMVLAGFIGVGFLLRRNTKRAGAVA